MADDTLGILLISADHARLHACFLVAAGAAALGRGVVIFATGPGVRGLCAAGVDAAAEAVLAARGVAGLAELRSAAIELGVRLIACPAGLASEAIDPARLLPAASIDGMASFLEATRGAQMLSL